jgi:hypothetical protein
MKIIDLAPGEVAPEDADKILLVELPAGVCGVSGMVRTPDARSEPIVMVTPNFLPSLEEARAVGIAWAERRGATRLFVETPGA